MTETVKKPSSPALRVVKVVALNMVPGYPLVSAVKSFRATLSLGVQVIGDLSEKLPKRRSGERVVRTWDEAMAARPHDAAPLSEIERSNIKAKWLVMVCGLLSSGTAIGNLLGGHYLGAANCVPLIMLCLMFMFKHEHRLRQMETGPLKPDAPLLSPRNFISERGFLGHLFNPRLHWE